MQLSLIAMFMLFSYKSIFQPGVSDVRHKVERQSSRAKQTYKCRKNTAHVKVA